MCSCNWPAINNCPCFYDTQIWVLAEVSSLLWTTDFFWNMVILLCYGKPLFPLKWRHKLRKNSKIRLLLKANRRRTNSAVLIIFFIFNFSKTVIHLFWLLKTKSRPSKHWFSRWLRKSIMWGTLTQILMHMLLISPWSLLGQSEHNDCMVLTKKTWSST